LRFSCRFRFVIIKQNIKKILCQRKGLYNINSLVMMAKLYLKQTKKKNLIVVDDVSNLSFVYFGFLDILTTQSSCDKFDVLKM
jgi:hypothetical protein